MVGSKDEFSVSGQITQDKPVTVWRMATNEKNLFYMLAAGMIMPPQGFGKKYYQDTLSAFDGYVPLFPEHVSVGAIEHSCKESPHLRPCILHVSLENYCGPVLLIDQGLDVKKAVLPIDIDESVLLLLVPAPLPVGCIQTIIFRSKEDRSASERDAKDFNNVDLSSYKCKVSSGEFSKNSDASWPPFFKKPVDARKVYLDLPQAAGAIMGLLLYFGRKGGLALDAAKDVFDAVCATEISKSDPIINAMSEWVRSGKLSDEIIAPARLFWSIVERVATTTAEPRNGVDKVLDYLTSLPEQDYPDQKIRDYGKKLASDLRSISGVVDRTVSDVFSMHPKPVSRAMVLFVLRDDVDSLLQFHNQELNEVDYIYAAILFAARQRWIAISNELRQLPGLNQAVSHRMAALSHMLSASEFTLGAPPDRPMQLIELFHPEIVGFTKAQAEAALLLSRTMKWDDCLETTIKLSKGDYKLTVEGGGATLTLDGDVKAVHTSVVVERFLSLLLKFDIDSKDDAKVRERLLGKK